MKIFRKFINLSKTGLCVGIVAIAAMSQGCGDPSNCSIAGMSYTAFRNANGPRCLTEDSFLECLPGDRCVGSGLCEIVLSGNNGQALNCAAVGRTYDAFSSADGGHCPDGSSQCMPGDLCVEDGVCETVLSASPQAEEQKR